MLNFITLRAFAVHIFTACGAALALLALIFGVGGHWAAMFLCLGLALIVDGIDGPLARRLQRQGCAAALVGRDARPRGRFHHLRFRAGLCDRRQRLAAEALSIVAGVVVCITGALYFADRDMKADDNYFRGFPALWNFAAFYLYIFDPPAWLAAASLIVLAVLTFVPGRFVHPLRVKRLRALNIALLVVWAALALTAIADNLEPHAPVKWALGAIAVYFLAAGLLRKAA